MNEDENNNIPPPPLTTPTLENEAQEIKGRESLDHYWNQNKCPQCGFEWGKA